MEKTVRERRQERHALIGATEFGVLYDHELLRGAPELTGRFQPWLELEELLAGPFDAIRDGDVRPLHGLQSSPSASDLRAADFQGWAGARIEGALAAVHTARQVTPQLLALAEARASLLRKLAGLALPILQTTLSGD